MPISYNIIDSFIEFESISNLLFLQDSILFDGRDSASPSCDNTGNFTLVRKKENRVEQWARYSQVRISAYSDFDFLTFLF